MAHADRGCCPGNGATIRINFGIRRTLMPRRFGTLARRYNAEPPATKGAQGAVGKQCSVIACWGHHAFGWASGGALCLVPVLLLDHDNQHWARAQEAEGMMQEPAGYPKGNKFDLLGVENLCDSRVAGVNNDEADPSTMRSEISSSSNASKATRVLICDDETRLVVLTAGLLREFGYEVLTVQSGEDAIDCVKHEAVDVVVLDVNLPGEDTLSVARRLIQNSAPAIVLSSGFTEEDVESELLLLPGVRAFLAKPYGIEALSATIRQIVTGTAIAR